MGFYLTILFFLLLLGSKTLYVARAQKKAERKQYLQHLHEEKRNEIITKSNASFFLLFVMHTPMFHPVYSLICIHIFHL